jgi:hypothetical protein
VSWRSDLATLRARTWAERGLLLEAILCLGLARAAILMLPFRRVVALCRLTQGETPKSLAPELVVRAARVGWAVRAASVRSPWQSTCLAQALAATLMLRRRGVPGTLYLGVARRHQSGSGRLEAHAWLRCGETILTGVGDHDRFTAISSFHAREMPRLGRRGARGGVGGDATARAGLRGMR